MLRNCIKSVSLFGVAPMELWPFELEECLEKIKHKQEVAKKNPAAASVLYTTTVTRINDRPLDAAYEAASTTHATEYLRLDPDHVDPKKLTKAQKQHVCKVTKLNLRQCLSEGYPVVFAIAWLYDTYEDHFQKPDPSDDADERFWAMKDPPSIKKTSTEDNDGHVVLAVGFDDKKKRILCQNSWGLNKAAWASPDADYNRFFWMPYSWIDDYDATSDFWTVRFIDEQQKKASSSVSRQPTPLQLDPSFDVIRPTGKATPALGSAGQVAFVSNNEIGSHAFWISADGAIEHLKCTDGKSWSIVKVSDSNFAITSSAITALIVGTNIIEIFWIGEIGKIMSAWCDMSKHESWEVDAPTHGKNVDGDIAAGGLCAMVLKDDRVSLACVAKDGRIMMGARTGPPKHGAQNSSWDWAQLAPPKSACVDPVASSIAALSRDQKSHLEIWWIGPKGSVESMHWHEGQGWSDYQLAPEGSASLRSRIAVTQWERPNHMGVYYVSPNGSLVQHHWNGSWSRRKTFMGLSAVQQTFADGTSNAEWIARVDSGLAVVARDHANTGIDVVWVSADDSLCTWNTMENLSEPRNIAETGQVTPGAPLGAFYGTQSQQLNVLFACTEANSPLVIAATKK